MNVNSRTYLSQWIEGDISDNELENLVSEEDFIAFQKLRSLLSSVKPKDLDKEGDYAKIQVKLGKKQSVKRSTKIKSIPVWWKYTGVAATIALFFGLFQMFYFSNVINTGIGNRITVELSDQSEVILNSKSTLSYPNLFRFNRSLKLDGEAYFSVHKGSTFTVKTKNGEVQVLGTKFNVSSFNDYLEVVCYEGKVKVLSKGSSQILMLGEYFRLYDTNTEKGKELNQTKPSWLQSESSFKKIPFKYVIEKFERQYGAEVIYPEKLENILFTGSFPHRNKEVALKAICTPLNLNYTSEGQNILMKE